MQQPCSRCGYISDRPARFCRQCGSQLFDETDVTAATTRNIFREGQERQQPQSFADQQSANYAPGYAPGGWAEQTPGTSPFYQAPAFQYQQQVVEQKKSFNWAKWILLSFLTILLFTVMVGGTLFFWGKQVVERAIERAAAENPGGEVIDVPPPIPPIQPWDDAAEARSVSLASLKYPGAAVVESKVESEIDSFAEVIRMTTNDDLETVKNYYDKKFGEMFKNSATRIQNDDEKYIYTALSHPLIIIEIEPDDNDDGKARISIAKVSAPVPNFEKLKEWQSR